MATVASGPAPSVNAVDWSRYRINRWAQETGSTETATPPGITDYENLGISGVDQENINRVNREIAAIEAAAKSQPEQTEIEAAVAKATTLQAPQDLQAIRCTGGGQPLMGVG